MFTPKHYKAIAEVLRANQPGEDMTASRFHHQCLVGRFGELFTQDNPRFDGDKFFTAATRPE